MASETSKHTSSAGTEKTEAEKRTGEQEQEIAAEVIEPKDEENKPTSEEKPE